MFLSLFKEGWKDWSDSHFPKSIYGLAAAAFHLQHVTDRHVLYDPQGHIPAYQALKTKYIYI